MTKWNLRLATQEDAKIFFDEGLPFSIKAQVLEYEGTPAAIGGIYLKKGAFTAFLRIIKNDLPKYAFYKQLKKAFLKTSFGSIVTAIRDENEPNSERLLIKLGFEYSHNINNQEVWTLWHKQQR